LLLPLLDILVLTEEFEDTKGVIRSRKLKKNRQHNDQKKNDKKRSTKHTHKTKRSSKTNHTKNRWWTLMLLKC